NIGFAGNFGVLLSANTALTVTADATVRAGDGGVAGAEGFAFEHGRAEAFLRLRSDGQPDSLGIRTAETVVDGLADTVDQSGTVSAT
ncbi:hypothetical protein NL320_26905, partial [Klebsiella pneumoniae]|nr:hypothetical protein [Klebsiella pneumoniae]